MKGMTLEQSLDSEQASFDHSILGDGLKSVGGAAGIKAALSAENRGEEQLIKPDGY
jgi:hypothetical protein